MVSQTLAKGIYEPGYCIYCHIHKKKKTKQQKEQKRAPFSLLTSSVASWANAYPPLKTIIYASSMNAAEVNIKDGCHIVTLNQNGGRLDVVYGTFVTWAALL